MRLKVSPTPSNTASNTPTPTPTGIVCYNTISYSWNDSTIGEDLLLVYLCDGSSLLIEADNISGTDEEFFNCSNGGIFGFSGSSKVFDVQITGCCGADITNTPTPTPTQTPTNTSTQTPTNTSTQTPTNTSTQTPTNTSTQTPTNTSTQTPTTTTTLTATPTQTSTQTPTTTTTLTATPTQTSTQTPTTTTTLTATPTQTPTQTQTGTPASTQGLSPTPTTTQTQTPTPSITPPSDNCVCYEYENTGDPEEVNSISWLDCNNESQQIDNIPYETGGYFCAILGSVTETEGIIYSQVDESFCGGCFPSPSPTNTSTPTPTPTSLEDLSLTVEQRTGDPDFTEIWVTVENGITFSQNLSFDWSVDVSPSGPSSGTATITTGQNEVYLTGFDPNIETFVNASLSNVTPNPIDGYNILV
jgi:hypothetical protein